MAMVSNRSGRLAALSLVLIPGLASVAEGGDIFKRCGGGGCCDTTVKLPAQQVVVEAPAPRVIVQPTAPVRAGLAAPLVGTVYMPLTTMLPGVTPPAPPRAAEPGIGSALLSVHAAEAARLEYDKARSAAKAELDAAQRAYDRLQASCDPSPAPAAAASTPDSRLKDLTDKIEKVCDRITAIEKLSLIHDAYLKEQISGAKPMSTDNGTSH
jgi:hypothetical protein